MREVRECLVEEHLSLGKRKSLGLTQELLPSGGVESRTQAGLVFFAKCHGASVEVGKQLRKLCGNGPDLSRGDGRSDCRCRRLHRDLGGLRRCAGPVSSSHFPLSSYVPISSPRL